MRELDYRPSEKRKLVYRDETPSGATVHGTARGDNVYKLIDKGVVVVSGKQRSLIPWNRVVDLMWDVNDESFNYWMECGAP